VKIVGLDIATVTGWCKWEDLDHNRTLIPLVETGEVNCKPKKSDPEGMRYAKLSREVREIVEGADAVAIEQPFSKSMRTATVLGGLVAVTLVHLEELEIPYVFVAASTLKAFGRKRMDRFIPTEPDGKRKGQPVKGAVKAAMHDEAVEFFGGNLITDNEADAWWLCRYFDAVHRATEGVRPK